MLEYALTACPSNSMHEQNAQLQRQSPGHPPNPPPAPSQHYIPEELQRAMEDTNSEIGVYLGIIYFVIEVFRHDEMFGDELSESKAFLLLQEFIKPLHCSGYGSAVTGIPVESGRKSEGQVAQGFPREKGEIPESNLY